MVLDRNSPGYIGALLEMANARSYGHWGGRTEALRTGSRNDWNLERKLQLITAAFTALPPGGAFIVIENLIDDDRRENVFGLMLSLHMLIEAGDAFGYTGADFRGWCTGVGFQSVEVLALGGPASAGIAYK